MYQSLKSSIRSVHEPDKHGSMIEDDPKSLSLIRSNLSSLSMIHKVYAHYEYTVGNFELCIDTPVSWALWRSNPNDISIDKNDRITNYDTVQVQLYEWLHEETKHLFKFVHLEQDAQFAGYQYIKYTKPGHNRGKNMPIANLCELIRYLHRLSNLTAFL